MTFESFFSLQSTLGDCTLVHAIERFAFPGGERHVRISKWAAGSGHRDFTLTARVYDASGVMELLLIADAVRRAIPDVTMRLVLPYVPYARQDRVALAGEPLSIAVFCRLINDQQFATVTIADPHSPVTPALLDRVVIEPPSAGIRSLLVDRLARKGPLALVAPDAGASKRVHAIGREFKLEVIQAHKTRNPKTGAVSRIRIEGPVPDRPLLVVDDICDGGSTFIKLSLELSKHTRQPICLFVTHGLFSQGVQPLLHHFHGLFAQYWADPRSEALAQAAVRF